MGKIIGGGLPVGAVGASRSIMAVFDPLPDGPSVVHGGTYNANPLTMAAGLASMEALGQSEIAKMAEMGEQLRDGLEKAAARHGIDAVIGGLGSVASITFGRGPLRNYRDRERLTEHSRLVAQFHRAMLDQGVLIAAQGLAVLSTVMEGADVQLFLRASDAAFRRLA